LSFLIDTNVISELSKRPPNPGVMAWFGRVRPSETFLSVAVLAELRSGVENNPRNRHGVELGPWLETVVRPRFAGRILGVDEATADLWGRFDRRLRQLRVKEPVIDALLAATALTHEMTVVTRNVSHFEPLGVKTFDPHSP
jgi:hypothetical protein